MSTIHLHQTTTSMPAQYGSSLDICLNRPAAISDRSLSHPRFTLQVDGKARGCVGTAARRRWQSQEPLPLGVWSRKPSARRPGRAGSHF
jgi:hypothetical protein